MSAVTRNNQLADELRILVRRYRHDSMYGITVQEATRVGLVAAASRPALNDWRSFVGDWLTELAFDDLEHDEGRVLHSHFNWLCHVVPELWVTCGRAEAALRAFNER